ncbi:MAG: D-glycero-beta-D-manno-heptose 1-phosphate adenylyltransferase [Planctomycetota bacterium]
MIAIPSLDTLGSPEILVIGDLILDEYLWGEVSRVSPEAPVPVLRCRHREFRAGGAGSVVENLSLLGAKPQILGVAGDDEAGRLLTELLGGRGGAPEGIIIDGARPTTRKTRLLASVQQARRAQQQVMRVDWEDVGPIPSEVLVRAERFIEDLFRAPPAAVLVSDYEKGLLTPELLGILIERARSSRVPLLVDPGRGVDYSRYRGAHLICPNRFEAQQATGIALDGVESYLAAGRALVEGLGLEHAVLTLDREGIYLVSRGGEGRAFPTRARDVTDVAGAGDMVLSLLGLAIAAGWGIEEAIGLANTGAGIEVTRVGVAPLERWELEQALLEEGGDTPLKVRPLRELVRLTQRARAAGRKVVFTNGCFDLLHAGHVLLLERARACGEMLIVGLNSDASIRALKGDDRPVLPFADRARILSSISAIDHIVAFDDETPLALIEALLPDVLVKGGDYADRVVVGRNVVEGRGGRIELIPLRPEISTSNVIERIRGGPGSPPGP